MRERKLLRKRNFNYSTNCKYFITICTKNRVQDFGYITNYYILLEINDNLNVSGALAVDTIKKNANTTVLCDDSLTVHGQIQINNRFNNATAGEGQIYLNGGNGNRIDFNNNGVSLLNLE